MRNQEERAGAEARAAEKRARLGRMRAAATGLLLAMAALTALAAALRPRYPAFAWLLAFGEAGLVGGLADWFAVVALFRHPLGLPFPHTAIVPRNKDRIGRALGAFVERNFLTPANIVARLEGVDLAGHAVRWLARPSNAAALAAGAGGFLPRLVEALDDAAIEAMIGRSLAGWLDRLDMARLSAGLLTVAMEESRHQALLDAGLGWLAAWLDRNRDTLAVRVAEQSRYTPRWLDAYVVNRFINGLLALIEEVVAAPRHEVRDSFDEAVRGFVERLRTDPELIAQAERLKQELIRHLAVERLVATLWAEVKRRLAAGGGTGGAFETQIAGTIARLAGRARQDPALIARLNAAAIRVIEAAVGRFHRQVSALIAGVVERWDATQIARNIELEVGPDLQFIRLNGTLVGGAAGLALHAVLALLGIT